jgi:prepilin-type processing-associated H-X9-DG protein
MADIKNVPTLVALYLGRDQKLDFRYGGLSPVCFVDGHVKAVTPEEAKSLRWEP